MNASELLRREHARIAAHKMELLGDGSQHVTAVDLESVDECAMITLRHDLKPHRPAIFIGEAWHQQDQISRGLFRGSLVVVARAHDVSLVCLLDLRLGHDEWTLSRLIELQFD